MVLTDDTFKSATQGRACSGSGGYSDIRSGAQVTVSDGNGKLLATTALTDGKITASNSVNGDCMFEFIIKVPDADFYAVEVSHRGQLKYSKNDLEDRGWLLFASLGS
jgi:hypothetical protein